MTSQPAYDRTDAAILFALGAPESLEGTMKEGEGLTWSQIIYWLICAALILGGLAMAYFSQFVPWAWAEVVIKDLGTSFVIAGILGSFVERFFRKEFARDAFLAAFRRVLPDEFRDEVEKIIRNEWIAEEQTWAVKIEKISDDVVSVTTSFERTTRNKSKSNKWMNCHFEVEDFKFCEGRTQIFECGVQGDGPNNIRRSSDQKDHPAHVEVKTDDLMVKPGKTARVWGSAIQYRRTDDCIWENFRVAIKNPVIEVDIDETEFWFDVKFGTPADKTKAEYSNRYTLDGVYFPGQFMFVRWWPKKSATKETVAFLPQLPGSVGADPAQSA